MELDTGSAVYVLPLSKYNTTFKSSKLQPTTTVLKTYTGERIQPDDAESKFVYGRNKGACPFWSRLARKDHTRLESNQHIGNHTTRKSINPITRDLDKYSDVFEEDIGLPKNTKAKLNLKLRNQPAKVLQSKTSTICSATKS
jgi:hypothetical protein